MTTIKTFTTVREKFKLGHPNSLHSRKSPQGRNKGFTIAEMMIVTTIMAILFSIGGWTYFQERDRVEYNNALIQVMGVINTARNRAISSESMYINDAIGSVVPIAGYGVHINLQPTGDNPHLTLFANLGPLPNPQNDPDPNKFDSDDLVLETVRFPRQVDFEYLLFDNSEKWKNNPLGPTAGEAVIMFRPPLAETYLGDNNPFTPTEMEELGMRFFNRYAPEESPKRCQYVRVNRVKTFPEISYSNCSEFTVDKP